MIYSDPTNKQGIVQDAYFEVGADENSYPIEDVTRNANLALDEVVTIILSADGKWQFDDKNAVDLPIGETDLVSGQNDYSFDSEYLTIKYVEILDPAGNWIRIKPVDNDDLPKNVSMSQLEVQTGVPTEYDKMGESIVLIPTPNYNWRLVEETKSGLRVYFQRKINYFTVSDTIKEPGFAKHLHKYISLYVANAYARAKELAKKEASLTGQLNIWAAKIRNFYSYRQLDTKKRIINNTRVKR